MPGVRQELEARRELLFADEDQAAKLERDPAAPARRSPAAERKVRARTLADGTPVQGLLTLLDELASQVRNTCRPVGVAEGATFELTTLASPSQHRAMVLVEALSPETEPEPRNDAQSRVVTGKERVCGGGTSG